MAAQRIGDCAPNRAHEVLAAWSHRYPGFTLVTQNVDGLHERAGTANVVRMHGSIWEVLCWSRCDAALARWEDRTTHWEELPPRCPRCGGVIRPGVVWFGEALDADVLTRCEAAVDCDLFATVGTSSVVYPAAALAPEAKRRGAFTVEVNPEATPASDLLDLSIRGPAEEVLVQVERLLT